MKISDKRARLTALICIAAIGVILMLVKCMPTEVSADPVVAGPPTLYEHVAGINASLQFFKWAGGMISGLFVMLIGSLGYAYKRDIARLDKKSQVAIDLTEKLDTKYDGKIDYIEENFMSIATHDRICRDRGI